MQGHVGMTHKPPLLLSGAGPAPVSQGTDPSQAISVHVPWLAMGAWGLSHPFDLSCLGEGPMMRDGT